LRRGASSTASPGRGRSGLANRGGHAFTGGRAHTGRGGYASFGDRGGHQGSTSFVYASSLFPKFSSVLTRCFRSQGHGSGPTPQSFFNNARKEVRTHALIENAINRLRDEPSQTIAPKKKKSKQGEQGAQPAMPMRANKPLAGTRYGNLASPEQFMSHFPAAEKLAPHQAAQNVPSQKENRPPTSGLAQPAPSQISIPPVKPTKVGNGPPIKPTVGLSGSMWASPPAFEHVTQVPRAGHSAALLPHQQGPSKATAVKNDDVKLANDGGKLIDLPKAGLSASRWAPKGAPSAQQYPFTGRSATPSEISNQESQTAKSTAGKPDSSQTQSTTPTGTFVATLPVPLPATTAHTPAPVSSTTVSFQSTASYGGLDASEWAPRLTKPQVTLRTNSVKVCKDNGDQQRGTLRIVKEDIRSPLILAIDIDGERILEESVFNDATFVAKDDVITYKSKENASPTWEIIFPLPFQARGVYNSLTSDPLRPISEKTKSHLNVPSPLRDSESARPAAIAHAQPAPLHNVPHIDRQFSEMSLAGDPLELISIPPVSDSGRGDVNHRISTRTFNLLNSLEGGVNLVEVDDEREDQQDENNVPSALMDLAVLNDDYIVQGVFQSINGFYDSFLNRLFSTVGDNKLGQNATTNEFMNSPQHIAAAERLVGDFFGHSEVFARLKENEEVAYIKDMGWKILGKALMERDEELTDNVSVTDTKCAANDQSDNVSHSAAQSEGKIARNYSVEDLLGMRNLAVEVKEELLSKKEMKTPSRIINPNAIVGYTGNGRPIVAGREEIPRTTRATPSVKSASSVGSWQSFAKTGTSAEPQKSTQGRPAQLSTPPVPRVEAQTPKSTQIQPAEPAAPLQDWQTMFPSTASNIEPPKSKQDQSAPPPTTVHGWSTAFKSESVAEAQKPTQMDSVRLMSHLQ
jgi:hypothetical protein